MQFSLRTLLVCVSALAVYLTVVFALPFLASYICLMLASFLMAPVIVTGVVYDRGYARTFWIGCAVWVTIPVLTVPYITLNFPLPIGGDEGRILCAIVAIAHGLLFLSGGVAMAARWLIETKNRGRQTEGSFDTSILHGRVTVARLHTSESDNE